MSKDELISFFKALKLVDQLYFLSLLCLSKSTILFFNSLFNPQGHYFDPRLNISFMTSQKYDFKGN